MKSLDWLLFRGPYQPLTLCPLSSRSLQPPGNVALVTQKREHPQVGWHDELAVSPCLLAVILNAGSKAWPLSPCHPTAHPELALVSFPLMRLFSETPGLIPVLCLFALPVTSRRNWCSRCLAARPCWGKMFSFWGTLSVFTVWHLAHSYGSVCGITCSGFLSHTFKKGVEEFLEKDDVWSTYKKKTIDDSPYGSWVQQTLNHNQQGLRPQQTAPNIPC